MFARMAFLIGVLWAAPVTADDPPVYPVALLGFQDRGAGIAGHGEKLGDLVFANLAAAPELYLVERAELAKIAQEQQLTLSGLVQPTQAVAVGQLTGARILVVGTVVEASGSLYLVAKLIGVETGRVLGATAKGAANSDLAMLAAQLADSIRATIRERSGELVSPPKPVMDVVAGIRKELGDRERPSIAISVEERHIGQPPIDPAVETELIRLCKQTGFDLLDAGSGGKDRADVIIEGAGFSEVAARHGNLITVKARLEVKAVQRTTGRIIAGDAQTVVTVDLAENVAGKSALTDAANKLAERLLPRLAQ